LSAPDVLEALRAIRIVPVAVIDDGSRAGDVAEALSAGGIGCAEITLRTPAAIEAIGIMAGIPGFVVGAGTVLTADQVDSCVDAGASFIVSPGFDPEVVERALERGIAVIPGVATATEIQRVLRQGLSAVKFFPADRLGGADAIKSLAAPFSQVSFMPSGGVTAANAAEYLSIPSIFAVSGSWMLPRDTIANGDMATIQRLSAAATGALVGIPG
jgi:2-dehydro-3-deoxyphosphogluconate aldolase/(4S)-4-hydroxy-2-oxoglutarate aldolase